MGTKMSLKTAALLLLLAFLAACDNTKQTVENSTKMVNKLPDEVKPWFPPKVSVLDLASNESQYEGKIVEIHGYMSWNDTRDGEKKFYLVDSQDKDEPHVVVSYGNCSNLREIITQDPMWNKFIPVTVVGIFHSYGDKITNPDISL